MYTATKHNIYNGLTINVTDALKSIYQRDIRDLPLDSLLDEAMRIHSSKKNSELYGRTIHEELVRRDYEL